MLKKKSNKNTEIAISVKNVSKTFHIPHEKVTSIKGAVTGVLNRNKGYPARNASASVAGGEEFKVYPVENATRALDNVSFEVYPVKASKQFDGVKKGNFLVLSGGMVRVNQPYTNF